MGVNPSALFEGAMSFEGMGGPSLLGFNDFNSSAEELNQRIIWEYQTFEANARDELRRKEEEIQKLIQMLKLISQERDEAREQLQMLQLLLKKFMPMAVAMPIPMLMPVNNNAAAEISPVTSYLQPESPQLWPPRANSGTTESDSLSDTCNHRSYVSSPVESFLDTSNASPDIPSINMADSCHIAYQNPLFNNSSSVAVVPKSDQFSARVEHLVAKRPLPEKGKLMDAVMKAGPLLNSLMVAGPLPRWKNPPPPQPLQIPPVSVKGRNSQTLNQTAALGPNPLLHTSLNPFHKESSQSGVMKRSMAAASPGLVTSFLSHDAKRQKSQ